MGDLKKKERRGRVKYIKKMKTRKWVGEGKRRHNKEKSREKRRYKMSNSEGDKLRR